MGGGYDSSSDSEEVAGIMPSSSSDSFPPPPCPPKPGQRQSECFIGVQSSGRAPVEDAQPAPSTPSQTKNPPSGEAATPASAQFSDTCQGWDHQLPPGWRHVYPDQPGFDKTIPIPAVWEGPPRDCPPFYYKQETGESTFD